MKQFKPGYLKLAVFSLVICFTLGMASISFAKFIDFFWYTDEGAQYGGDLDFSMAATPNNMDPHMGTTTGTGHNNTMNGLIRVAPKMTGYEPDLAESWERLDPLTVKFNLRKGVKFQNVEPVTGVKVGSNGREVTSADVKYSLRRLAGLEVPPPPKQGEKKKKGRRLGARDFRHSYYLAELDSIETPDKYTVIIKTKTPFAPLMNYLGSAWAKIVPKEVVDQYGHLMTANIGSGPFILKEFRRDSHMLLVKNPDYFKKGKPYVDSIKRTIITDPAARLAAFMAHKLDFQAAAYWQRDTLMEQVPDAWFQESTTAYQTIFRMPPRGGKAGPPRKPFSDVRVRRAIVAAVDKDSVVELGEGGFADKNVSCINGMPGITLPQSEQPEYNPEKARKLLAEAGYPNGFKTTIMTWSTTNMQRYAQIFQAMLKEVGIDAQLNVLEFGQYFRKVYTYKYDLAVHVMTAAIDPDELLTPYWGTLKYSTYYKWDDPVLHEMIEKQKHIMNRRERAKYIQDIQRKVLDQAINIFVMSSRSLSAYAPYLHIKNYYNDFQRTQHEFTWIELDKQKAWKK